MRSKINACLQFLLTNVFSAASHKGRPCKWIINACTWDGYLSTPTVDHANNMLVINALHISAVVTMFASANALTCIRTCCFGFCVFHGFEITPFP